MFNWKIGVGALKHPGFNGGDSPPPAAPTQTTVQNTNIPDYARPYVENMLNAAQAQIYNTAGTGFNPYVPYSGDPTKYVAGFSPLQQQAQTSAAGLRTPLTYAPAIGQTMGATGQMGMLAPQMGMAGTNYNAMATDPRSINAFMNPYIQASLAPQLALANQQYGIAGQQEQSNAARSGAFGGSREALMNSLNAQNQMLAQNQLIGQGYNNAFNAAQQAQQYGAGLGLQGQQAQLAALQGQLAGAGQLAGLGGQQLAAQQSILGTQTQQGALQQANQQNIINQAVQNYATAQQYPYMQLGTLNSMLRGLPMQQTSTQMYQAPPSAISQLAGLGTAAYGASKLFGQADGGVVKAKEGGVMKAAGGLPMSSYSPQQLLKVEKSMYASPIAKMVADGYYQDDRRMQANPIAPQVIAQTPLQTPQPMQPQMANRVGLGSIATPPNLTTMNAAGGGLLAFAGKEESLVPEVEEKKSEEEIPSILLSQPKEEKYVPSMLESSPMADVAPTEIAPTEVAPSVARIKPEAQEINPKNLMASPILERFKPGVQLDNINTVGTPLDESKLAIPESQPSAEDDIAQLFSGDTLEEKWLRHQLQHPNDKTSKALQASLKAYNDAIAERDKTAAGEALLKSGLGIMAGTSPHALVNIGQGAPAGIDYMAKVKAQDVEDKQAIAKLTYEGAKADDLRDTQLQVAGLRAFANKDKPLEIEKMRNRLEVLKKTDPTNPLIKDLQNEIIKKTTWEPPKPPPTDEELMPLVDMIGTYQKGSPTISGRSLDKGELRLVKLLKEKYPDYNDLVWKSKMGDVNSRIKLINDFQGSSPTSAGGKLRAINAATAHLDLLKQTAEALKNGSWATANELKNEFKREFGSVDPTNFDALRQLVAAEVVNSVVARGGTAEERRDASDTLSPKYSPQQLSGTLEAYRGAQLGQLEGLHTQYVQGMNINDPTKDDFAKYLSPRVQNFSGYKLPSGPNPAAEVPKTADHATNMNGPANKVITYDANGKRI
jgi:hypothetical protein